MKNIVLNTDCRTGIKNLADKSVDCVITSPPYWALRDYGCEGQIGMEPTPEIYIKTMVDFFMDVYRVLKDDGTCFVNLGDTYSSGLRAKNGETFIETRNPNKNKPLFAPNRNGGSDAPDKSLLMIPYRFAWAMVENGWILRNVINWNKPNQMPQSSKDRFTVDFEPIFFFTKNKKYYFEQQFENLSLSTLNDKRNSSGRHTHKKSKYKDIEKMPSWYRKKTFVDVEKGRNMRTTWRINTKGLKDAHFAVYPPKLVARMIKSGCPVDGIVLDPFMGAGTTAIVARKLSRNFIGFELNKEYCNIINKRIDKELGLFK